MNGFINLSNALVFVTLMVSVHTSPIHDSISDIKLGWTKDVISEANAASSGITSGTISGEAAGGNGAQTGGQSNSGSASSSGSSAGAYSSPSEEYGSAASDSAAIVGSSVSGQADADGSNSNSNIVGSTFGETDSTSNSNVTITNGQGIRNPTKIEAPNESAKYDVITCVNGSPVIPAGSAPPAGAQSVTTGNAVADSDASHEGYGGSSTGANTGSASLPGNSIACSSAVADATGTEGSQTSSNSAVGTTAQNSGKY